MITGECVKRTDLMPPRAQLSSGAVSTEPADIGTHQCNTKHIHLHRGEHRYLHVVYLRVVVTQPDRAVLAHACEVAAGDNHCTLLLRLEPLV